MEFPSQCRQEHQRVNWFMTFWSPEVPGFIPLSLLYSKVHSAAWTHSWIPYCQRTIPFHHWSHIEVGFPLNLVPLWLLLFQFMPLLSQPKPEGLMYLLTAMDQCVSKITSNLDTLIGRCPYYVSPFLTFTFGILLINCSKNWRSLKSRTTN